ncbi:MAG: 2TM domain-containing protein [Anaerolineae bacterium]|nr:2TM domain-containing protein [Anaerolineae bacterium]
MHDEKRYKAARRRIRKLKEFYMHVMVYVAINIMLVFIDLVDGSGGLEWFYFPALGWGAAVLIHAFDVFILDGWFGTQWEDRKMQELMGEKAKRKRKREGQLSDYDGYAEEDDSVDDDVMPLDDLVARTAEDAEERARQSRQ